MPYDINGVWHKPKPKITVWKEDKAFLVEAPYNERYLRRIKQIVPWQDREWNRIHKGWVIHLDYYRDVKDLLLACY